MQGNHQRIRTE